MVALCHSQEQAREVKARLAGWLAPRGLVFNEDKTKIVSLGEAGFDFLGFNVRRYGGKPLIKPSKAAIGRIRKRLAAEAPAPRRPHAPPLAAYWADRRRWRKPPVDSGPLRLIQAQKGRCPVCAEYLLHADREPGSPREWEQWLTTTRKAITKPNLVAHGPGNTPDGIRLLHVSCYRRVTGARRDPAILHS